MKEDEGEMKTQEKRRRRKREDNGGSSRAGLFERLKQLCFLAPSCKIGLVTSVICGTVEAIQPASRELL